MMYTVLGRNVVKILLLIVFVSLSLILNAKQQKKETFFKNGYCIQKTAKTQVEGEKFIKAKIHGKWGKFELKDFPEKFVKWNTGDRLEQLNNYKNMMMGKDAKDVKLAGAHNGVVATYGYQREDSRFKLNNAVKGMGFLPKRNKIKEIIKLMDETADASMLDKMDILTKFYENPDSIFALDKQISLELYSQKEFMTQTFLNQMTDPAATIVYLDIPSFKLKTITRLLDPNDPELSDYEKDVVSYINKMHSYFHGHFSRDFIAVIYYVVEVYDNSPRGKDPETGMGRKMSK
ncbi:MAG: hypothetical protein K8S23_15640 [Candidatus Cloacimonetes bacterium]|nr:hypothetical protein [Candidatus Cloacimonadota bacterium]